MRMRWIFLLAAFCVALSGAAYAQEFARDIVPRAIEFGEAQDDTVEISIRFSVLTAMADTAHVTSLVVSVNDIPSDTLGVIIDAYDLDGRPGACWGIGGGTGSCASRSCLGDAICVLVSVWGIPDYCSCDLTTIKISRISLDVGDDVNVLFDPDDLVPENDEDNNSFSIVYEGPTSATELTWGTIKGLYR